ncbi:hypothetical protein AAFF_G00223480 [Aldrovandia affinis]|uniref:Uveal autoantigen with coiled-coil domains and ankyrin repeats n=1 Tax=Aldrovandia affinis TaxID=143900 RepID=A0AAD7TAU3_9TELE|nr:hypothetical protein AAFF_G00223480 [Aldrovandia affinis]
MKSLKNRLKKQDSTITNTEWNKYDERLLKAVERGELDKVATVLKKGVTPTKLDLEGRSAFHLAASRGHLGCVSLLLAHGAEVTATDGSGKNALHLAARNGHPSCVQKLLEHSCPVGNVDLQGRNALHDAVMAGCSTSVQLLCDSGADVNSSDLDVRTPLGLATQMCHPQICQLLLERGADITARDKQNKTALILGCEYGCKEAVEVLLSSGADVMAMDRFGYDSYHYARLSKSPLLVAAVKNALDTANKAKHMAKLRARKMSMERKGEGGERPKSTQQKPTVEELQQEGDSSGQAVSKGKEQTLVPQPNSLDSAQVPQSSLSCSGSSPLELSQGGVASGVEAESLRRELVALRRGWEEAKQEVSRLQGALASKSQECEDVQREADRQVRELEEALEDVQKRMLESEAKVKQLQVHVVAMREHLSGQPADGLRAQLLHARAEYEDSSKEAQRLREELRQSQQAQGAELREEHERLLREEREARAALEDQNVALKTRLAEAEALVGEAGQEREELRELVSHNDQRESELQAVRKAELQALQERERELGVAVAERAGLSAALQEANTQVARMEQETRERAEEVKKVREELRGLQAALASDYISLREHREAQARLRSTASQEQGVATEAQEEVRRLCEEMQAQKTELDCLQEAMRARFVPVAMLEEKEARLGAALREAEEERGRARAESERRKREAEEAHGGRVEELRLQLEQLEQLCRGVTARRDSLEEQNVQRGAEIRDLRRRLAEEGKDGAALLAEREALVREAQRLREALREEQEGGAQRAEDVASLQAELLRASEALRLLRSCGDAQEAELAAEKRRLEEEVCRLEERLSRLTERCEEAQREAGRAQEGEELLRVETEALRGRSSSIQREVEDLKERYRKSVATIQDLQHRIHTSSQHNLTKDQRITELMADVDRLKQALSGDLSQLAYGPGQRPRPHPETLQDQVTGLQQQLADAERQHREVVSIYRTHLLTAAQGHMDEEVQAALLQILQMRKEFVC